MDVSSRYFSLLKRPSIFWLNHFWNFLIAIYQVGKSRELFSFALWEIGHLSYFYQLSNRYIKFTDNACLSITSECIDSAADFITSPFLAEQELCFRAVPIDWMYCFQVTDGTLWGCRFSHSNALYYSCDQSQSATLVYEFIHPITSLFISQQSIIFVCSHGVIYRSDNHGNSFKVVLQLSTPISYFLFNNGMTELPDCTLMIGEYGSIWHGKRWQNLAFLYYSVDGGETWTTSDFLMRQGVNKHIHLVKYSNFLKSVLLTDGDNKKQVWANTGLSNFHKLADKQKEGWRLINKFHHQTGGYTSMAETKEAVLLGSDYLGGTNFIVRTTNGRKFEKLVLPDPYRRSPVMNMISRQSLSGDEIWAFSFSCLSDNAKSLLMCTKDSGKSWTRVLDFKGTENNICLVSSSYNLTDALYISITEFGEEQSKHRHRVYKLEHESTRFKVPFT